MSLPLRFCAGGLHLRGKISEVCNLALPGAYGFRRLDAFVYRDAQARSAAVNEVLGLGWNYDQKYISLIEAVTAEQIQSLARELFAKTLIARTLPEHPVDILNADTPSRSDVNNR